MSRPSWNGVTSGMEMVSDLRPDVVERLAGAAEEALQVVRGGGAGIDLDAVAVAALADLDEGGEEVVHAVAELLDVGVLVGGALVAVDGDALVDDRCRRGRVPCRATP